MASMRAAPLKQRLTERRATRLSRPTTYTPFKTPLGRDAKALERRSVWRRRALEIDFSDPDVYIAIAGALIGLGVGIGFPVFMVSRDKLDQERLEALRELNRETYEATGEYLSKVVSPTMKLYDTYGTGRVDEDTAATMDRPARI